MTYSNIISNTRRKLFDILKQKINFNDIPFDPAIRSHFNPVALYTRPLDFVNITFYKLDASTDNDCGKTTVFANYMISVSREPSLFLERIIQALNSKKFISVENPIDKSVTDVPIKMDTLSLKQQTDLWTAIGCAYRPSLFYRAGPILLDSEVNI